MSARASSVLGGVPTHMGTRVAIAFNQDDCIGFAGRDVGMEKGVTTDAASLLAAGERTFLAGSASRRFTFGGES